MFGSKLWRLPYPVALFNAAQRLGLDPALMLPPAFRAENEPVGPLKVLFSGLMPL